jgi:hypothetical protein
MIDVMASSVPDARRFLLAKEFGEVFQSQQFQAIPIRQLTQAYQSKHRKNFSPRQLGFSRNLDNFVDELPIFNRVDGGSVTLSRCKFLEYFFRPVLKQCGGITGLQKSPGAIAHTFKSCTGIEIESICKVLQVSNIGELLSELTIDQDRVQGTTLHAASGEKNEHLRGRTDPPGSRVENESLQAVSPIRKKSRWDQPASPVHREAPRMDVDLLSRPPRALLPHPQLHPHTVVGGHFPVQVPRSPPPQQISSQTIPQQPSPSNMPKFGVGTIPPPQKLGVADSHRQHKGMIGPPHHIQERGAFLISHQQPRGATGIGNVIVDPGRRNPGPPPAGDVLPEYLPLSHDPRSTTRTPRRISSSSSPSLSPGPHHHVVPPQVITSHRLSPIVGHPSPLSPYHPPPTNAVVPKFPNPNLALGQETILPSHSIFRPDLPVPQIPPGATELSSSRKKRGSVASDSKQKAVEKINAKVEELINDLSSQGKFLQSETVRSLVMDIIYNENCGRRDRIVPKDITAMLDYSKVHGRIEELIKIFCRFSPITSLHELELAIVESEKVDNYEALHLGPIIKHPKVIDLFRLREAASLDTVPDITAYKIQNYLMKFLSKRRRAGKQSLEDFLEYIREREFAESVYHLCIRITSFPLAIQVGVR